MWERCVPKQGNSSHHHQHCCDAALAQPADERTTCQAQHLVAGAHGGGPGHAAAVPRIWQPDARLLRCRGHAMECSLSGKSCRFGTRRSECLRFCLPQYWSMWSVRAAAGANFFTSKLILLGDCTAMHTRRAWLLWSVPEAWLVLPAVPS